LSRILRYFLWTAFLCCLLGASRLVRAAPRPARPAVNSLALLAEQPAKNESSSRERLFDWINFILLVGVLVYALRKPLARFFAQRSSALEHALEEGRTALEAARVQLAGAEGKMRRLEEDIAVLKAAAVREREAERERLQLAAEEEARRILESARAMIESATQAAKLELRSAAASEAVALAERMIRERLDEANRARLVSRFLQAIEAGPGSRHN
jgi:F-type H+-transporting ATPase subunit b